VRGRRRVTYTWHLRQVMADHGLWQTTELIPLLAERGVELSAAQVYRLCAGVPERLSLRTLAALCDIFECTPNDLIETAASASRTPVKTKAKRPVAKRPRRARITPESQQ
jgi:DNA-binding Xre family transcriptional regulator